MNALRTMLLLSTLIGSVTIIGCTKSPPAPAAHATADNPSLHETLPNVPVVSPPCETGELRLDEQCVPVRWSDGDTFSYKEHGEKQTARLAGYNTLESYGPVHRWGTWTGWELYHLAKSAGPLAAAGQWNCTTLPGSGGYGRKLVDCPDLRLVLLQEGLAHLFHIDTEAAAIELTAQQTAIANGTGMWAKGAPTLLLTSLHSEDESDKSAYNRVCDLSTGRCLPVEHSHFYSTCQEVVGPQTPPSYMTYVPYTDRYGVDRADCLR